MSTIQQENRTMIQLDETDRKILRLLQRDCSKSLAQTAKKVGLSKTALWNRILRL